MSWYYELNAEQNGPVEEAQLRAMLADGTLPPGNRVWSKSLSGWTPAQAVFDLEPPAGPSVRFRSDVEYIIDGIDHTCASDDVDGLIAAMHTAKEFWIVNLDVAQEEFIQYALPPMEVYEHWKGGDMILEVNGDMQAAIDYLLKTVAEQS